MGPSLKKRVGLNRITMFNDPIFIPLSRLRFTLLAALLVPVVLMFEVAFSSILDSHRE